MRQQTYDVAVIGGGPSGATAATDLARRGYSVLLLDRLGRIKPCGGAIPPRAIRDFAIPDHLLVARITSACIVSPRGRRVDMPIEGGFVGMVNREVFDEWLRVRAQDSGADRLKGTFARIERDNYGTALICYHTDSRSSDIKIIRARAIIGADGANSAVAREVVPQVARVPFVFAYHEIVRSPRTNTGAFNGRRCDVYYRSEVSPDFYGWIFPHGNTTSIGTGSANKGFSLRQAVSALRESVGLEKSETIRREGAPIPLCPLAQWDNGRDMILAGDAAGVVAPASGEGIYYAMASGRLAGEAVDELLKTGDVRALKSARARFMKAHGSVFRVLGMMQRLWYCNDERRERFVKICCDTDVQRLTWDAYMNKELVRARPIAHARIFFKNIAHIAGIVPA
jgi:geranylgeranyl diphosphate/geranylgeranyl-bacteriochlorophyllide a reductase